MAGAGGGKGEALQPTVVTQDGDPDDGLTPEVIAESHRTFVEEADQAVEAAEASVKTARAHLDAAKAAVAQAKKDAQAARARQAKATGNEG